jgi:glycosyltransferase involved in cell wall biosynthesis
MISILQLVASSRGGGAVHVRDLVRHLDHDRFAVTVAMPEDGGNVTAEDFAAYGVVYQRLDIASGLRLGSLFDLHRLLRHEGYDILHCHGARAALYGRLAVIPLGDRRPRVVYTVHGLAAPHYTWPKRWTLLLAERLLAPWTDAFIGVCEAERAAIVAAGIGPPDRVHVVRNGIDTALFRQVSPPRAAWRNVLEVPSSVPLITTVARMYFPKDFDTLLRAFDVVHAQQPQAHLLIVGDGPYRPRVEAQIAELDLEHNVTVAGVRRDIDRVLATSDIFVLSTTEGEGLPLTILEAMASGLPVVASDVAGIGEAVVHGETGLLVPPKDAAALAGSILELLGDSGKARTLGQKGLARVRESFTVEKMVSETAAIYLKLPS